MNAFNPNPYREHLDREGFAHTKSAVLPSALIERCCERMNALAGNIHDRGRQPYRRWNVGHPTRIQKIDNAHVADHALFELVCHPAIAELAHAVTGARMLQVWSTQLLYKPAGGGDDGCVGWHRDTQYWKCWKGTLLTVTVALSPLSSENGAMRFVRGSHLWSNEDVHGNAYRQDLRNHGAAVREQFGMPWEEVALDLDAGALAVHHSRVIHGSGPNAGSTPRRSIAINLRAEDAVQVPDVPDFGMCDCLRNDVDFPVVFDDRAKLERPLATADYSDTHARSSAVRAPGSPQC